jgi:hypothetical protein
VFVLGGQPPRPGKAPPRLGVHAIGNLLRMGHCAPTLVQTLLEAEGAGAPPLVALAAALPGMGNTGNECGGITGPLLVLGVRHARDPAIDGMPAPVALGRGLVDAFQADHGTTRCRDILGDARLPLRCFGVVGRAPGRCLAVGSGVRRPAVSPERQEAHVAFCAYLEGCGFHCAQAVLRASVEPGAASPELLDAASAFLGGTALAGLTCGALTGGLLSLGHRLGAIENSRLRVLRQVATMAVRGNAFADDRNAFNRAMNRGHDLAHWFAGRFGSTRCRELTGCDIDTLAGVRAYIERNTVSRCAEMAREVAAEAGRIASQALKMVGGVASALAGGAAHPP